MNLFKLTDAEVADVRAALISLGLDRRNLVGQFPYRHREKAVWWDGCFYKDRYGYCALGRAFTGPRDRYVYVGSLPNAGHVLSVLQELGAVDGDYEAIFHGLEVIVRLNDTGKLNTRKKVAALLALVASDHGGNS